MRWMTAGILLLLRPQADEWYKLEVTVTTTSDWTAVRFSNARSWVDDQKVSAAKETRVVAGPLQINKDARDETETTLSATVYVRLPAKGDLELTVTRGDLGATRVSIKGVAEIAHDAKTGEGTNKKTFTVSAEKVRPLGAAKFEAKKKREKLVLAFYYPWYGAKDGPSKRWVHWDPDHHNAATDTPELGLYDSLSPELLRKHIALAKEAGVDGFISSWWGRGGHEDRATKTLLEIAEKEKFLVNVYYEQARDARQLADDIAYLTREFGGSSAWLKLDGKPVIFVYGRVTGAFKPDDFARARGDAVLIMDTFDPAYGRAGGGLHTYNPVFADPNRLRDDYETASLVCSARGLIFAATVAPGYDDTVIRKPGGKRAREDGKFYDASWDRALAAGPDWILICSWNEWHEGSEIEPSKEYGDFYLKKTAERVRRWKGRE